MKHVMTPHPASLRGAGSRLSLGWTLRLLALLAGVLAMHLWVGPGSATTGTSAHDTAAPTSHASPASSLAGYVSEPHTAGKIAAAEQVLTAASTGTDHGSSDGSSCSGVCPNGHSMMTAMCMVALLVVGAAGLYWLRSSLISRWTLLRGPPVLTALPAFRPRTVSLVQLSISRT